MRTNLLTWLMIGGVAILGFAITAHVKIYLKEDPSIYKEFSLADIMTIIKAPEEPNFINNLIGTKMEFHL